VTIGVTVWLAGEYVVSGFSRTLSAQQSTFTGGSPTPVDHSRAARPEQRCYCA
jgi:hypothetical protein